MTLDLLPPPTRWAWDGPVLGPGLPHAAGLAIFACETLDLFEAVALPRVHRTRLVMDDTPHALELMSVINRGRHALRGSGRGLVSRRRHGCLGCHPKEAEGLGKLS